MTDKAVNNLTKGALVGAAVVAGSVVAVALKDEKTRKKLGTSLKVMVKKGIELKDKAEKWSKDHPVKTDVVEELMAKASGAKK